MNTTERLEDEIHDCETEMKRIADDAANMQRAVDALLSTFAAKYPHADTAALSSDFAAGLSDVVDNLQGPAYRRRSRLQDEIESIDWKDLMRSSPIVL